MLEVVTIISGSVIAFIAMVLWANSDRFSSHNDTDIV
jgi:hypothetical protein